MGVWMSQFCSLFSVPAHFTWMHLSFASQGPPSQSPDPLPPFFSWMPTTFSFLLMSSDDLWPPHTLPISPLRSALMLRLHAKSLADSYAWQNVRASRVFRAL
jgi:hypothetical protein